MLIVIGIVILVTMAATIMPVGDRIRRIREAARVGNICLRFAAIHAMETGRPCGVTFQLFGVTSCAMNGDQCEVPACYEGQTEQSMAKVNTATWTVNLVCGANPEVIPSNMVRLNDLIQFNHQGEIYSITGNLNGSIDGNGYLSGVSSFSITHRPEPGTAAPVIPSTGSVPHLPFSDQRRRARRCNYRPAAWLIFAGRAWLATISAPWNSSPLYTSRPGNTAGTMGLSMFASR